MPPIGVQSVTIPRPDRQALRRPRGEELPDLLFVYLIEFAFVALVLFAPPLARYVGWVARTAGWPWSKEREDDTVAGFRVMSGIGALFALYVCVVQTIRFLR
jgi:hypothetical protein